MPVRYSPITEMTEHIHDVVVKQMVHKILNDINPLTPMDNKLYIDTSYSVAQQATDNDHSTIFRNNKIMVKAHPNTNPSNVKWDAAGVAVHTGQYINKHDLGNKYPPVFVDPVSSIRLLEMAVPAYVAMEFEIELVSRDQAYEIPTLLYRRFSGGHVYTETVKYDYPIPQDILVSLYGLYKLRRFTKNPNLSFWDYLTAGSQGIIQRNVSRSEVNRNVELIIPKTNIYCTVQLEYTEDKPEEVKNGRSPNAYQTRFVLHMQYNRVDCMCLQYPHVVDNQMIPEFLILKRDTDIPFRNLDGTFPEKEQEEQFRVQNIGPRPTPIVLPYYDDWMIPRGIVYKKSYREFLIAGCIVNETPGEMTAENLSGILDTDEGYRLHPTIVEVLKRQGQKSFRDDCLVRIEVFANDIPIEVEQLELTEDLTLKFPGFNIHKQYRIVLYEITDIRFLNPEWYDLILDKWPFFTVSKQIQNLLDNGLVDTSTGTIKDPKFNVLGGLNDSYRPLRQLIGDIVAKYRT